MPCNDIKIVFRGEAVPSRAKKKQIIDKIFFIQTNLPVLNLKKTAKVHFLLKCSKKEKPEQERLTLTECF